MTGNEPETTVAARIATVLTCLAVDQRLGGVLFVDLPPSALRHLARWMGAVIAEPDTIPPRIVTLGSNDWDEHLWWQPIAPAPNGSFGSIAAPGPVVDLPLDEDRTIIIPDLARASLAVMRAALVLIGADTASADRHGRHLEWQPRSRWLAACRRSDLRRLSAHLLDRFAVRVDAAGIGETRLDAENLRAALDSSDDEGLLYSALLPPTRRGSWTTLRRMPSLTDGATKLVVDTIGTSSPGLRREFALARAARTLAVIDGVEAVTEEQVTRAATLLGVAMQHAAPFGPSSDTEGDPDGTLGTQGSLAPDGTSGTQPSVGPDANRGSREQPATALDGIEARSSLDDPTWTYPEDHPSALPEYASLRMPWQKRVLVRRYRGPIVGTEPTTTLGDLAFVATALEAAKFQPMRRHATGHPGPALLIGTSDLRRHRRQSEPDTAVVFILDHTCRKSWDWSSALVPYLRWAHMQRAAVTVVEFGHAVSPNELRAEKYRAIGVTDNRVAESLQRLPGRATPLAYALDVAVQELRKRMRYGQAPTERAWLVVASDGRGNVPLEASLRGRAVTPTGREGIDDALLVAARIRSLPAVQPVVLAPPELAYYSHLPFDLADAMGGVVADTEAVR